MILIVDDTPRNIQVLGNVLRENGYIVAAAHSGFSALESIDLDRINRIIAQIQQHNAPLAEALAELIQEYRFDILQQLFETTQSST